MKKIQTVATNIGVGIGAMYAFFSIPSIAELFQPSFLMLLKQTMAMSFGICLLISPSSLIEMGAKIASKIPSVYNIFFGKNNKNQSE